MEEKEVVTSGKMTQSLIGFWIVFEVVFAIIYNIVYGISASLVESYIAIAVIAIILQGIFAIIVWKCSTLVSFSKKTVNPDGVSAVMRNLTIFTIFICVITAVYNIGNVNSTIEEATEKNSQLEYYENIMSYLYDDEEMAEYQAGKEQAIQELKSELYTYVIILDIGLTVVYLGSLLAEKKFILKYVNTKE